MRRQSVFFVGILLSQLAPAVLAATLRADRADLAEQLRRVPIGSDARIEGLFLGQADVALELTRFRVFAPDARVVVNGGERETAPPDNAYFAGRIPGDPEAKVLLSALERGLVRGLVFRAGGVHVLGQRDELSGAPIESRPAAAAREREFNCDVLRPPAGRPAADGMSPRGETPALFRFRPHPLLRRHRQQPEPRRRLLRGTRAGMLRRPDGPPRARFALGRHARPG